MRALLDTQIFIWYASGYTRNMRPESIQMIADPQNTICLSHISLLEIAIKQKIGKLDVLPIGVAQLLELAHTMGFELLPISAAHIAAYERIPLMPDHRNPFDRLLLATALAEDLQVISAENASFPQYAPLVSVITG